MIKKFFFDSDFWKVTLRLALPIAIQNMLTSSYVLVDTLMVGQLGDVALSSVGMAGQLNWLMNILIFGICSGASVFWRQCGQRPLPWQLQPQRRCACYYERKFHRSFRNAARTAYSLWRRFL